MREGGSSTVQLLHLTTATPLPTTFLSLMHVTFLACSRDFGAALELLLKSIRLWLGLAAPWLGLGGGVQEEEQQVASSLPQVAVVQEARRPLLPSRPVKGVVAAR